MTHSTRRLPKDILDRPDSEAVELLLGKRVKKCLDQVAQDFENKPITKRMSQRYNDSALASSE